MKFSKDQYVLRNFSKIYHKKWELYIITRIVHFLNDLDIEFVCQQSIKTRDGKSQEKLWMQQALLKKE